MNYKDLITDDYIKNILEKIDENNHRTWNHGVEHALNVVKNIEKLAPLFDLELEELEYLKMSAYLHDVGQLYGKENHALNSKKIVSDYLKGKINSNDYHKILLAIEKHHEHKEVKKLSLFEHLLLFADKMDFSFKRLDMHILKEKNILDCAEMHILTIDFVIEKNKFIVAIKVNQKDVLENWSYFSKIKNRIEEFADKIKMNYEIRTIYELTE